MEEVGGEITPPLHSELQARLALDAVKLAPVDVGRWFPVKCDLAWFNRMPELSVTSSDGDDFPTVGQ